MPKESALDATQTGATIVGVDRFRFVDMSGPTSEAITVTELIQALGTLGGVAGGLAPLGVSATVDLAYMDPDVALYSILAQQSGYIDPRSRGAALDCQHVDDGAMTNGSPTLTSATGAFLLADEGKTIAVCGGGTAGATLVTTIDTFVNAGQVTLSANCTNASNVTATDVYWGTDDTAALQQTISDCASQRLALWLPAACLVTGAIDARVTGLKIFGVQGYLNCKFHQDEQTIGNMARSTIVSTYGGASDAWDVTETPGHEYTNVGFIFANSALTGYAMNFTTTGGSPYTTQQHRFRGCLFGMPHQCMPATATIGMTFDGCFSVHFDACAFFGFEEFMWVCDPAGESFSNAVTFTGCTVGAYNNYAFRYPCEGFTWVGGHIQSGWTSGGNPGLRFLACGVAPDNTTPNDVAGDTNVSILGAWFSDVIGAAAYSAYIIAGDPGTYSGTITVVGGRTGGDTTNSSFVKFIDDDSLIVSIHGVNKSGGYLIDWGDGGGGTAKTGNHVYVSGVLAPVRLYTGTFMDATHTNHLHIAGGEAKNLELLVSSPTGTALATGDSQVVYTVPKWMDGWSLIACEASTFVASASAGPILVQIRNSTQAVDMLTTRINIDNGELHSKDAATQPAITAANADVAYGDQICVDVDDAGDGAAKGLNVVLTFHPLAVPLVV